MSRIIQTESGKVGEVVGVSGTKLLCEELDRDCNRIGSKFAVEAEKAKNIGFIDYPKDTDLFVN